MFARALFTITTLYSTSMKLSVISSAIALALLSLGLSSCCCTGEKPAPSLSRLPSLSDINAAEFAAASAADAADDSADEAEQPAAEGSSVVDEK